MRVTLDYHRNGLEVEIPDGNLVAVLNITPAKPLPDVYHAVRRSLAEPIACPPLPELCQGKKTACIVVSDITRPVPNKAILPPLLRELEGAGIKRHNITVLIGTGIHRPNEGDELVEMLGDEIVQNYRIENHAARDEKSHCHVGTTPKGIPIHVDRRYVQADVKIVTGLIEPHLMAGYSGGRKGVLPGICSLATVREWHSPRFLEHPNAAPGVLDDNPVHEEAVAAARLAGVDLILNVVLNDRREVVGVFAGDMESAFYEAVRLVEQMARAEIGEPVEIVVTSCAGYPLDTTYYQATKGFVGALPAVKPAGTIIMAAGLKEGIGGSEFTQLVLNVSSLESFTRDLMRPDFFVVDQWQLEEMAKAKRHAECWIFSEGLPKETLKRLFVRPVESVERGIEMALETYGRDARIVAIPRGPYVLPIVGKGRGNM